MTVIGGILIFLSAILFSFGFQAFEKGKLAEEESICRFLDFVKNQYLLYATPIPKIAETCQEPLLEKNGYLPALRGKESASVAFAETRAKFSVSEEMLSLFDNFSLHFGRETTGEETKRLDYWCLEAETILQKDRTASLSRVRLCKTLSFSFAIGIFILFL